jgi:hypothetical protein
MTTYVIVQASLTQFFEAYDEYSCMLGSPRSHMQIMFQCKRGVKLLERKRGSQIFICLRHLHPPITTYKPEVGMLWVQHSRLLPYGSYIFLHI